jgi:hypothetical protein
MARKCVINVDLADVREKPGRKGLRRTLAWGDEVSVTRELADEARARKRGDFFGFSRAAYGLIKTRTDGKRLLVYTDRANLAMKEAYAYELDAAGVPQPVAVLRA